MRRRLKRTAAQARNLRPAYQAMGNYLVGQTQQRIKREVSPNGIAFAKLRPKTIEAKQRRGQILKRLQAEGTLIASIAAEVRPKGVAVGSNQKYASIHQFGGKAGRGGKVTIPARPYLGLNAADISEITGLLEDWLLLL